MHSPDAHVIGLLAESVLPKLGVKSEFARAVYESLRSEVRRCSGKEQRPASAEDLQQTRTVSRAEVERLLASARVEGDAATWTGVSQLLTTWNVNPVRAAALRRAYTRVMIDRLDPANQASTAAFEDVRRVIGDIVREGKLATFEEVTSKIASELRCASWRIAYSDDELAAVSCVVLHEFK